MQYYRGRQQRSSANARMGSRGGVEQQSQAGDRESAILILKLGAPMGGRQLAALALSLLTPTAPASQSLGRIIAHHLRTQECTCARVHVCGWSGQRDLLGSRRPRRPTRPTKAIINEGPSGGRNLARVRKSTLIPPIRRA
jgi:hypothetical protein